MGEHCQNPWNKRCKRTDIVLYIQHKGKSKPICAECWIKLAKGTREWGKGDMRPPVNAKVITDETGMAIFGKLRVEDKEDKERVYTWQQKTHYCSRCKTTKPLDQFYIKKNGTVNAWCKECSKEYSRSRRKHPMQNCVDVLLDKVVKAFGFEGKGYKTVVSRQLSWANGNAHISRMFEKNERDIRLIKVATRDRLERDLIDTIIHEIAHFEHTEKAMIEDGIRFYWEYINYLKANSWSKTFPNYFHNIEFQVIFAWLKDVYKRSTAAG